MSTAMSHTASLEEAIEWLRDHLEDGTNCPCCGQMAKIYRRKINSGMARLLITQWRAANTEWAHTARIQNVSREGAKLAYWGLMESDGEVRDDGGHSGRWRITGLGRAFVCGEITVPKYVHVFDGMVLWHSGPEISVQNSLGTRFNYRDLMDGI